MGDSRIVYVSEKILAALKAIKPGDKFVRNMAGTEMNMVVRSVENGVITADAIQEEGSVFNGGWTFSQINGGEIDLDLGWDPPRTPTGSFIQSVDGQ